ncbi:MAG: hypothetical protein H0V13_03450 [Nocardioidaceae bacterium]|jgi:hypothetical protein|nr:hypothetical protein [Nocardioidaceae bacterium]
MADAAFLLALLFLTLFVTTFVFADDGTSSSADQDVVSIEELPISAEEKGQFTKMTELEMVDEETVAASVSANAPQDDRYSFSWLALAGTVALALAYLGFVYAASFKEYREVVRARFGPPEGGSL